MHAFATRLLLGAVLCSAPAAWAAGCPGKDEGAGIRVPDGFCAQVFAQDVGDLRHLAVGADGTVYAALSSRRHGGGIAVLRPRGGHGELVGYFGAVQGTGIGLHGGYLYFGENDRIVRFPLASDGTPQGPMQIVVSDFPRQHQHAAKSLAFDGAGHLYVNVGAPSNACQQQDRRPGSPGIDPCPLLAEHGGIWRFSADRTGQRFSAAARYATGLRNDVAIAWNRAAGALYAVMMGRDQLHDNWPQRFTVQQSAELPAEELLRIEPARDTVSGTVGAGASRGPRPTPSSASPPAPPAPTSHRSGTVSGPGGNYGWPYCYYDGIRNALVLAPEYGGDGKRIGRCARYRQPLAAFPAHWAPEAIAFYDRDAFPARYRGGAFIAFHGSWNRAPLPQQGFVVAFVPFANGRPSGPWRVFADGFAGRDAVIAPGDARFRPVGVAVAPDGALYVADSQRGWIWRITYSARQ